MRVKLIKQQRITAHKERLCPVCGKQIYLSRGKRYCRHVEGIQKGLHSTELFYIKPSCLAKLLQQDDGKVVGHPRPNFTPPIEETLKKSGLLDPNVERIHFILADKLTGEGKTCSTVFIRYPKRFKKKQTQQLPAQTKYFKAPGNTKIA